MKDLIVLALMIYAMIFFILAIIAIRSHPLFSDDVKGVGERSTYLSLFVVGIIYIIKWII